MKIDRRNNKIGDKEGCAMPSKEIDWPEKPRYPRSICMFSSILAAVIVMVIIVEWLRLGQPITFNGINASLHLQYPQQSRTTITSSIRSEEIGNAQVKTKVMKALSQKILATNFPPAHQVEQQMNEVKKKLGPGCLTDIPEDHFTKIHLVEPPAGNVTLVCCQSTKGVLNIAVHHDWAPFGAQNFIKMVNTGFFSSKVPMFRALKGFIIQFGLAGDPSVQSKYARSGLPDDTSWLPFGPKHRHYNGTFRYQKGYLGYAGAGKNSRGTQLIVALEKNEGLGGGSPWEVPWGQVIGAESYRTLASFYTGYGENPSQGKIMNRGREYTEKEFPLLDYIVSCETSREGLRWKYRGNTPLPSNALLTNGVVP